MSRGLLDQDIAEHTLERVVAYARELVDGCERAGMLLLHRGREVETPATTGDLVRESDRLQGELEEGPCFDAVVHNQSVYRLTALTQRVTSWPRYAPEARQLGIASVLGFQLFTAADTYAALDVHSSQPRALPGAPLMWAGCLKFAPLSRSPQPALRASDTRHCRHGQTPQNRSPVPHVRRAAS